MPDPAVIVAARQFKTDLLARETVQMQAMARRWLQVERAMLAHYEALAEEVARMRANGETVNAWRLFELDRYHRLLAQLRVELARYSDYAARLIETEQRTYARLGIDHAATAIEMAGPPSIATSFTRLPTDAVEYAVGAVADGTPLGDYLQTTWGDAAQGITDELVRATAMGQNPRQTAKRMADGSTRTLNRMLNTARTEQLRVYRLSSREQMAASGVVTSYRRIATHDSRTCFTAGTMVATPNGERPIESIRAGDLVLTHMGPQRVTASVATPYNGELIEFVSGAGLVRCTPEHPVWVGRGGAWAWLPAGLLKVGDEVVHTQEGRQLFPNNFGDGGRALPPIVDGSVPLPGDKGIAPAHLGGILMPVPPVNLQVVSSIKDKVESVPFARNLLLIGDAKLKQNGFGCNLKATVAGVCPIAMVATEVDRLSGSGRDSTEGFSAVGTRHYDGGPATLLGAVLPIQAFRVGIGKDLAAPLAGNVYGVGGSACLAAISIPMRLRRLNAKLLAAGWANFRDILGRMGSQITFARAVFARAAGMKRKLFSAMGAWPGLAFSLEQPTAFFATAQVRSVSVGRRKGACVGWGPLENLATDRASKRDALVAPLASGLRFAFLRAVGVLRPLDGRRMTLDGRPADSTVNGNHASIISHVAMRQQAQTTVYNLEVDGAHTYFAGGTLVHNCAACLMDEGHEYGLGETMPEHNQGRCSLIPVVADMPELQWQKGPDWFMAQNAKTQESILGKGRYAAFKAGQFDLDSLITVRRDPTWGDSLGVTPLGQLVP